MRKILVVVLFVLGLQINSTVFAYESSVDIKYFAKETAKITENIVLLPFRIIRDIFDPQPPQYPIFVPPPYYYGPPPSGYVIVQPAAIPPNAPVLQAPAK